MIKLKINQFTRFTFFILISVSCNNFEKRKLLIITEKDSSYQKGEVYNDSVFHGIAKYYDKENKITGYANFRYGVKNGPGVLYFESGIISDSLNYTNGLENGFGFKYNSLGKLTFKSYYFQGMNVGHVITYGPNEKIKEYYFNSFERKILYSIKQLSDSVFEEHGDEINATVYKSYEQEVDKVMLFLYVLNPPYYKNHYEIGIFDSNKKIISSKKIETNKCFYEQQLEDLPEGYTYGIIMHKFNSYKHKDDLVIKLIQ